jgi:hypothetical protein
MAIKIEPTHFKGWENCWRIANPEIELIVTADIGPRVIHGAVAGRRNLFKNFEEQMGGRGEATWMSRGGSRIGIGPEDLVASYAADNTPVEVEIRNDILTATARVEAGVQVQKEMIIRMPEKGSSVEIRHRVRNAGLLPAEFAVWVLTVMAPGGVAVTGFPRRGTHPEDLAPSNPLVMWPFTDLSDPRWRFLRKYLMLQQNPEISAPQKLGHFSPYTWGAYFLNGDLFIKRYSADSARIYPDFGCSFEIFTNAEILELETMGPLCRVAPGDWIEHTEHWSLHSQVAPSMWTDDELDRVLTPLLGN